MIIACPACSTRYVVPDSSIGVDGRTVRCAKCKHSWYQDGPPVDAQDKRAEAPTTPIDNARPPLDEEAPVPEPRRAQTAAPPPPRPSRPQPSQAAREAQVKRPRVYDDLAGTSYSSDTAEEEESAAGPSFDEGDPPYDDFPATRRSAPVFDEGISQFESEPPFKSRRNYVKLWTWAAGIFAALALGAVVAISYFGAPDWLPVNKPLYGVGAPDLEIQFPEHEQERRTLANGTEYFGARIIITNTARETRSVPPILIVLRDSRDRIVYSWEIMPPQDRLAPGESMTINEATTDVPKSAVYADIGWAPR